MKKPAVRTIGEVVALVGVVLSLVFIGMELRQNARAARAAAYQELGIAISDLWLARATDRELNDAIALVADSAAWAGASDSDRRLVRTYVVAILRVYETVHLQVDEGLLDDEALASLGWSGFGESLLLRRLWPSVRTFVTPRFAAFLEASFDLDP